MPLKTGGIYCNGKNVYGGAEYNNIFDANDSVGVEVNFTATGGDVGDLKDIVDHRDAAFVSGGKGFTLRTRSSHTKIEFGVGDGVNTVLRTTPITQNEDYHVFAQYSISRGQMQVYLNNSPVINVTGLNVENFNNTMNLYIGKIAYTNAEYFKGIIRFVRLYIDKWFTAGDVDYNFNNPNNPLTDGLVLWLPFNENQGVIARDLSRYNNHARLYNCRWVNPIRKGLYFDNGGMYFQTNQTIDFNNITVIGVFSTFTPIRGGDCQHGRQLIITPYFGENCFILINPAGDIATLNYDGTTLYWLSSNLKPEPSQVYTAVVRANGSNFEILILSNGEILASNSTTITDCGTASNVQPYIGSRALKYYPLHGIVYAGFTFNRPLTEDEIKQISMYWYDENLIPKDGLVFGSILDRNRYGDVPYDFVNKVYATNIGTPRWVIRKPYRTVAIV